MIQTKRAHWTKCQADKARKFARMHRALSFFVTLILVQKGGPMLLNNVGGQGLGTNTLHGRGNTFA